MGERDWEGEVLDSHVGRHDDIPRAIRINDIEKLVKCGEARTVLLENRDRVMRYDLLETHELQREREFELRLKEQKEGIEAIKILKERNEKHESPLKVTVPIDHLTYTKATIRDTQSVLLKIAPDLLLAFPFQEAIDFLTEQMKKLEALLEQTVEKLEIIREQRPVTEMNITRVHNFSAQFQAAHQQPNPVQV